MLRWSAAGRRARGALSAAAAPRSAGVARPRQRLDDRTGPDAAADDAADADADDGAGVAYAGAKRAPLLLIPSVSFSLHHWK